VALSKVAAPDVETARAAHAAFESQLNLLLVAIDDRQESKPQFTFSLYVGCLGEVLLWELGGSIPVVSLQLALSPHPQSITHLSRVSLSIDDLAAHLEAIVEYLQERKGGIYRASTSR